ncbi:MAG: sigma-70 family RNA polymerase sigma factor [Chloroflexi bacterium]|nr:sigma-70 family RNA polymerase sigma factor [Chloroflexota bacterium]
MQDEERIVQRAQSGDEEAFSMLYEEHFDKVFRYIALRVRDRCEVEDMTQQVFVKAFEALPAFRWRGAPFAAWLLRIARNQIVDAQRKSGKQAKTPLEDVILFSNQDVEKDVEQKLAVETVAKAARQLTQSQQDVLALRFASEMSIGETAKIMGKNEGAIKALQHSAVNALRRVLRQDGYVKD